MIVVALLFSGALALASLTIIHVELIRYETILGQPLHNLIRGLSCPSRRQVESVGM